MTDSPYLVAIALIEQEGSRLMPIGGKSLKEPISSADLSKKYIETIALELLIRVMSRSEEAPVRRVNGEQSFLAFQIPLEKMQKELPHLKAQWIKSGDTILLLSSLSRLCKGIWAINFVQYEGLKFDPL